MDTLEIYISRDNGDNYELIYRKFGADLATEDSPLMDKTTMNACIFYPTDDEWRNGIIDLSAY